MENVVQLTSDGHSMKPSWLNSLGNSLLARFECLESLSDIHISVSVFQDAARLTPDGHLDKPSRLSNLDVSYITLLRKVNFP